MTLLSTLLGCIHLGVPPVSTGWKLVAVSAPVAIAGLEPVVTREVERALTEAGAARAGGQALHVVVLDAHLAPGRRAGDTIAYEAVLRLRFSDGGEPCTVTRTAWVADPGGASGASAAEARLFASLSREAAVDGVGCLLRP